MPRVLASRAPKDASTLSSSTYLRLEIKYLKSPKKFQKNFMGDPHHHLCFSSEASWLWNLKPQNFHEQENMRDCMQLAGNTQAPWMCFHFKAFELPFVCVHLQINECPTYFNTTNVLCAPDAFSAVRSLSNPFLQLAPWGIPGSSQAFGISTTVK